MFSFSNNIITRKKHESASFPNDLVSRACRYTEINRIRQRITDILQRHNQKTVLVTSPHDGAGNTFLVSVLGMNAALFSKKRVLIADLNMRRPELHLSFGLKQGPGFAEVVAEKIKWKQTIKDTGCPGLRMMSAGRPDEKLSAFLNRSFLEDLIQEMKEYFDLILFDTSPILVQNRNNIDPTLLNVICDMSIIIVQDKITTKAELIDALEFSGGTISGIVYNQ